MNLYVGTSGYSFPKWKGSFYPEDLPAKRMLAYYAEHFRTVEVNYTFRVMPTAAILKEWAAQVPADFQFVLKSPQRITHIRRLKNVGEFVAQFYEVAAALKRRLGPLLFQLHPNMKKDAPRLREFLAIFPPRRCAAFEFRHPSWFDDEVFGLLREHRAAMCLAETENDLDVPFVATADWGYLRLRRADYTDRELAAWLERVRAPGWREAFVFFKHEDEGKGPRLAKRFLELAAARSPRRVGR